MKTKPALFIFFTGALFYSCHPKKNGYEIDCEFEIKQAQNDVRYKNYTWTIFSGIGYDFLGEEEFIKLLNQHHIKTGNPVFVSCLSSPNDKYQHCYEEEMNRLIRKNFGEKFIDSLRYTGKQQFVKSHPDEIFSYSQCDMTARISDISFDGQFEKIRRLYFLQYPLPENYIVKTERELYSGSTASFILTKKGEIRNLSLESSFQNKKNNIFEKQFNRQLKDFVLHTKWIPARINTINVDSYMEVDISYP